MRWGWGTQILAWGGLWVRRDQDGHPQPQPLKWTALSDLIEGCFLPLPTLFSSLPPPSHSHIVLLTPLDAGDTVWEWFSALKQKGEGLEGRVGGRDWGRGWSWDLDWEPSSAQTPGRRCSKLSKHRFFWVVTRLIRNCIGEWFFTCWAIVCC